LPGPSQQAISLVSSNSHRTVWVARHETKVANRDRSPSPTMSSALAETRWLKIASREHDGTHLATRGLKELDKGLGLCVVPPR
jgi:hypothetical protein